LILGELVMSSANAPTTHVSRAQLAQLLTLLRQLELCDVGLSPGRVRGVVELLQRLAVLARGGDGTQIETRASLSRLAAGMHQHSRVSERTVRRWARDSIALGVLVRDIRSTRLGHHNFNDWLVPVSAIRELVEQGERPDTMSALRPDIFPLRPDSMTAPGEDTVSAPREDSMSAPLPIATNNPTTSPNQSRLAVAEKVLETRQQEQPKQPEQPRSDGAAASSVTQALQQRGVSDAEELTQLLLATHSVAAAVERIEQAFAMIALPENRRLLKSPVGAAVHFFRKGVWPVDGIQERKPIAPKPRDYNFEMYRIIKHGRKLGWSEPHIKQKMREFGIPPEAAAQFGWRYEAA
jgi:hypothetical protein